MNTCLTDAPVGLPESSWPTLSDPTASEVAFVAQWQIKWGIGTSTAFLFSGTVLYPPDELSPVFRDQGMRKVQLVILHLTDDDHTTHTLCQGKESIHFVQQPSAIRGRCTDMMTVDKSPTKIMRYAPRWRVSDADWPHLNDAPMMFVGQHYVHATTTASAYCHVGCNLYLFATREIDFTFAVFNQDATEQSAEAHYLSEELMGLWEAQPNDEGTVSRVVKQGDRYVHQFLLEHDRANALTLRYIAKHGTNKSIRTRATELLKKAE